MYSLVLMGGQEGEPVHQSIVPLHPFRSPLTGEGGAGSVAGRGTPAPPPWRGLVEEGRGWLSCSRRGRGGHRCCCWGGRGAPGRTAARRGSSARAGAGGAAACDEQPPLNSSLPTLWQPGPQATRPPTPPLRYSRPGQVLTRRLSQGGRRGRQRAPGLGGRGGPVLAH